MLVAAQRRAFILRQTRLQHPPLVPEMRLHLADRAMATWGALMEEEGDLETPAPLWAFAWAGGQAVARYLLDHPDQVDGRRVLDFAAGSGICAIAARKAGASEVTAADIDVFSTTVVAMNARANDVRLSITKRDFLDDEPNQFDVILAGDVSYEQPMAGRVLAWLKAANLRGTRVLIGDPGRSYFSPEGLVRLAQYEVPTARDLEGKELMSAGVFTFPV